MLMIVFTMLCPCGFSADVARVDRMGNYNISYVEQTLSAFTVFVDERLLSTTGVLKTMTKGKEIKLSNTTRCQLTELLTPICNIHFF